MSRKYPLDGLALEIKEHWRKYRPQMYRELEQEGRLDQSLHEASERTGLAFAQQVEHGLEPPSAWEAVRELWAFLPAESDEPNLSPSPPPLPASTESTQELFPRSPDPAERDLTEESGDRLLPLLRRCHLTRREQRVMAAILGADTPLTARAVADRTRLHYSHCKAVVRGLVAWSLLERTPEGLRFQLDSARWGPPTVPSLDQRQRTRSTNGAQTP